MKRSGFKKPSFADALAKAQSKSRNYTAPRSLAEAKARQVARDEKRVLRGQQRPKGKDLGRGKGLKSRVPSKAKTVAGDPPRKIKDEMDQLVREIIALRDWKCFTCPITQNLHVGHLFRRGLEATRWLLINNHAQCDLCNGEHEADPEPYIAAFIQKHGEAAYLELETASRGKHKFWYVELLEIRDGLRGELAQLKQRKAA
jgi:hypothetical protein